MSSHAHSVLSPQNLSLGPPPFPELPPPPSWERAAGARGRQDGAVGSREGEPPRWARTWSGTLGRHGAKERKYRRGESPVTGGNERHLPLSSPLRAPANRPDLRARGAQDAKDTAELFDVVLPWEKRGPVQQLPQNAAHGPADTEAKQLTDSQHGHRSPHSSSMVSHLKHNPITPHRGHTSPHTSTASPRMRNVA